ncbi:MAG: isoleucine--tRNA ligase [Actinobacteria bacterium]|nr:isoleucine--tRNA ligase [Actinomycetota bacterium]
MTSAAQPRNFRPLPAELDFPAMERRVLAFWAEHHVFDRLRAQNAAGPRWSFIDGPITANNPMGVHHAWGRTYKDVFQRYRAMRGFHQRYQNGFDCQGLWLEVEVEKELGFNSKRDIEASGLAAFAQRCRERVEKYSGIQTEQSIRLGQWMDWPNSYFTHTDTNIEHIWHFLQACHRKGWIVKAHRAMPWCARCGTALSQHELIDTYAEVSHDAVYVRLPVRDRPNTWLLVWTTTPWTLAANVAAAVDPTLEYLEVRQHDQHYILAAASAATALRGEFDVAGTRRGAELVGWRYTGPFDHLPAQQGIEHTVVAWDRVGAEEGTGIVHIAPGAGEEDFRLGRDLGLPALVPIDENGRYLPGYGALTGRDAREVAEDIMTDLSARGLLYRAHKHPHRYPHCWRCKAELVFRVDDEWFIRADEIRAPMLAAAAGVRWIPDSAGARMGDWLSNMGDWNISRRRFWGLPLPFYPCAACGHLTVIGSRAELAQRAIEGLEQLKELHRPWIDCVAIRCAACGERTRRIEAVGDAWLDAGIVPFSTLNYLDRDARWAQWYPADFVTEMREQIRLWFYSMLFMSVALENRAPYRAVFVHEKLNDETGRPMHKSAGNAIEFHEAAERMGADVMRWMYAGQNPVTNINFGYGPAGEVKRRLLTLWNVLQFFVTYARLDGFDPLAPQVPLAERADLDRWILSRLQGLIEAFTDALENYLAASAVRVAEAFFDELSNWYVRRGRRRYWKSANDRDKRAAYQTLYEALTTLIRLLAPVVPFWADDVYQILVRGVDPSAPLSVHLTAWPTADASKRDRALEQTMALAIRVVDAGREARGGVNMKLRQPLHAAQIALRSESDKAAVAAFESHIREELNVRQVVSKVVVFPEMPDFLDHYDVKFNYRELGTRYGPKVQPIVAAVKALHQRGALVGNLAVTGHVTVEVDGEAIRLTGSELALAPVWIEGYGVGQDGEIAVAISTEIDDDLRDEGLMREVVHAVQNLRKEAGLDVADRIELWLGGDAAVARVSAAFADAIRTEVLALGVAGDEPPADAVRDTRTLNGVKVVLAIRRVPA